MSLSLNPRAPQNSLKTVTAFKLSHLHTRKLSLVRENAQGYERWLERPANLVSRARVYVHAEFMCMYGACNRALVPWNLC